MMVCGPNIYIHMYLETIGTLTPAVQPRYGASIKRMEDCESLTVLPSESGANSEKIGGGQTNH